jgi:putative membrane protein
MERENGSEGREELAEDRTDLAEDRTILAHERSFAGWVRTGMAAIGIGLGFNALFGSLDPVWVPKAIATAFLVVSAYIFLSAEQRARRVLRRLDTHEISTLTPLRIRILSWFLTLLSAALAAAIWLLIPETPGYSPGSGAERQQQLQQSEPPPGR